MRLMSGLMAFLFAVSSIVRADTIVLKNGDQLSGKLKSLADGKIVFVTEEIGQITVPVDRVQNFSIDEPAEIHFADGTIIKSRIKTADPNQFTLEETRQFPALTFAISDLAAINPPPRPGPKWTGNFTVGLASTHGNTFTESGNVSFDANRRSEKDRTHIHSLYIVSRAEKEVDGKKEKITTEESFTLDGKYDYFFSKKLFGFVNGRFKKDHIADLDRRIIAGLGGGYQWVDEEKLHFNTDVGLAERCEQYTSRNDAGVKETTKTDDMSLQLGYHFDWKINDKFSFMHNLTYYPSFERASDYFLTADAEIRAFLNKALFASFKAILDYDSSPAEGVGTTDTKYLLGIGWNF